MSNIANFQFSGALGWVIAAILSILLLASVLLGGIILMFFIVDSAIRIWYKFLERRENVKMVIEYLKHKEEFTCWLNQQKPKTPEDGKPTTN